MASLQFKNAEAARDAILDSQKKEIAALYDQWADEIGERAKWYSHKSNASAPVSERQMLELQKQLKATSQVVSNEVYNKIRQNIYMVSDAVVKDNVDWLTGLGFAADGVNAAFTYVPDDIVRNLITGQIYDSGWSLSSKIWSDNEKTLKDIYQVMARGVAENKPIYDIAKDLENYVRPEARLPWNLTAPDGARIYKKQVDYNAQRLARTLVQHGYQQSFVATTQKNPFVTDYIWISNGSRVCDLCAARDGQHYKKDELPLDHPNGMCTMQPGVVDDLEKQLVDWFNSPDGTYPEIDEFAKEFGYVPQAPIFTDLQKKYLEPYGFSPTNMPKDFDDWSHKVSYDQASEILHSMGTDWSDPHPYQQLMKYYNQNLVQLSSQVAKAEIAPGAATGGIQNGAEFAAKYGTSKGKTFNYWYSKLDGEAKALAKQFKEESGLTWQQWYEQNIYAGAKPTGATAQPTKAGGEITGPDDIIKLMASQTESDYNKVAAFFAKHGLDIDDFINDSDMLDTDSFVYKIAMEEIFGSQGSGSASGAGIASLGMDDIKNAFVRQTQSDMLAMEARAFSNMTNDQSAGIRMYTGSSYTEMNAYLRYMATGMSHKDAVAKSGISKKQLSALKQARDGLANAALEKDLLLRRGTDLGDLAGFMPGDFETNLCKLRGMSVDELNQRFAGTTGTYAGFTSTSSLYDRGFGGSVEIIFRAPAGTQASSVMSVSRYGVSEGETLLNAGTQVRIDRIEVSDGHKCSDIRVYMDIIGTSPQK